LLKLLEDSNSGVRRSAAAALGNIKSEAAIPGLLGRLEHSYLCSGAVAALGNIKSEAAIPRLLKLLEHSDFSVRSSAAAALGNIKSEAAIPDCSDCWNILTLVCVGAQQ
jgi:HEAT repeat protein